MADTTVLPAGSPMAADNVTPPLPPSTDANLDGSAPRPARPSRAQALNKLYALPAPLRTFPLPSFVPHNPISLFHILYVWFSQVINPPSSSFDPVYQAWFSLETRSVHVTDIRSIRGLWEKGFYGKGNLSRSEPNWLKGEYVKRQDKGKATSEELTRRRRAERQQVKWERARKEREAIDEKLIEEAREAVRIAESAVVEVTEVVPEAPLNDEAINEPLVVEVVTKLASTALTLVEDVFVEDIPRYFVSPVGPMQLLQLPNSAAGLALTINGTPKPLGHKEDSPPKIKHFPKCFTSPVGPLQLLALPNSAETYSPLSIDFSGIDSGLENSVTQAPIQDTVQDSIPDSEISNNGSTHSTANGTANLAGLKVNGHAEAGGDGIEQVSDGSATLEDLSPLNNTLGATANRPVITSGFAHSDDSFNVNGTTNGFAVTNGSAHSEDIVEAPNGISVNGHPSTPKMKRQKSVRFSPTVEQTTFLQTEPPSPDRSTEAPVIDIPTLQEEEPIIIKDEEHGQLTLEEAFFLTYGLGALTILDPATKAPIPNQDLFTLFRQTSYFPPRPKGTLSPDDPFLINYIVYHHFRSLGWVVRSGIKFSVDFMLYNRGPVFSHAEFAVIILPSYSDPYWASDHLKSYVESKERRTWAWMSCINRVISQVKKTLVIVYVDIPKPLSVEEELALGVHGILGQYKVREIVMKRFSANRQRE